MLNMCFKILEDAEQLMFLSLKSINNIKRYDHFTLNILDVCYCIMNNILEKDLENTSDLIVNYSRNTLDIITVHKMINSRLNNAHDVIS